MLSVGTHGSTLAIPFILMCPAVILKMIKDLVPESMKCGPDARDVIISCLNGTIAL